MHNGSEDSFRLIYHDSILAELQCRQVSFWGPMDRDSLPTIFRRAYDVADRRHPGLALAFGVVPVLLQAEKGLLEVYGRCTRQYLDLAPRKDIVICCLHPNVYVIGSRKA